MEDKTVKITHASLTKNAKTKTAFEDYLMKQSEFSEALKSLTAAKDTLRKLLEKFILDQGYKDFSFDTDPAQDLIVKCMVEPRERKRKPKAEIETLELSFSGR